jgi:hypothetical protein
VTDAKILVGGQRTKKNMIFLRKRRKNQSVDAAGTK